MEPLKTIARTLSILAVVITTASCTKEVETLDAFFSTNGKIVTAASYPTDETSHQFLKNQDLAGINQLLHKSQLTPTDNQPIVRLNRDTYYSFAVVDISNGASITIPVIAKDKYVSVQPVTEDHRIQPMFYGPGTFELTTHTGSHIYVLVRLDGRFSEAEAKKIQAQMKITAQSNKPFTAEPVNQASFQSIESELKTKMPGIVKRDGLFAVRGMFTAPTDASNKLFTQEKYEVGAAIGWAGAQWADNIYETSGNLPMDTCHQATFSDPKNKAFWSITVYDKAGFMFNDLANVSSRTATKNTDGTYTVSFGCGKDAPNNIETVNNTGAFNLAVRHYQPGKLVREEGFRILPLVKAVKQGKALAFTSVDLSNYKVAESDIAFGNITKLTKINTFFHFPVGKFDLNNQTVVRMNQDTTYSAAIVNASKGASITLPESNGRYMSVMVVQNDHYINQVFTTPGTHEIKVDAGFDFVFVGIRTRVNANDLKDIAEVKALQKAIIISAKATEPHVLPNYDIKQVIALRDKFSAGAAQKGSLNNMQGARGTVDEHMHMLGTAAGWGLLPDKNARYLSYGQQDGQGCFTANFKIPPFNKGGFFSITMYNADGWMFDKKAILNEYNIEFNSDGTFDANFGSCGESAKNNIPIVDGWNFLMRVYQPKITALDKYEMPVPVKVN